MPENIKIKEGQEGLDMMAKGYTFNAYAVATVIKEDYIKLKAALTDQPAETIKEDIDKRIEQRIQETMVELNNLFSEQE